MTQEDVIKMAREALKQEPREDWNSTAWVFADETLEAFAKLVAEHEQKEIERLKALCDEMLSELYVYRASEYLKDVTASIKAIRARGQE